MGMVFNAEQSKRDIVESLEEKRWDEALAGLEVWCERFQNDARSWLNRGYCLVHLERYDEALAALDRCLEIDPSSSTALGWRKKVLAELDKALSVAKSRTGEPKSGSAVQAANGKTRRVAREESAAPSLATVAATNTGRGWIAGRVVDGRYEVHEVARGGMAVVSIAYDRELQRMVAVKTPLPSVLATEDGKARFQREAESWIALGVHPNICSAYYLQEIGGMPRLFIEYVDGGDLGCWLRGEEEPSFEQRFDVAIQIASGLDYTHNFLWTDDDGVQHRGIVHRDIKPANVLLTSEGIARVTDFGLVRAEGFEENVEGDIREMEPHLKHTAGREDSLLGSGTWQTVTVDGGLVGTPPYMAPELWRQSLRGTVATDIYAYGCMLYEIFCGRRPFMMPTDAASQTRENQLSGWMRMHVREEAPDPRLFEPRIEGRLAALMQSCVAKDPNRRPQSFGPLREQLVEIYRESTGRRYPRPEPQRTRLLADSLNNRGVSFITLGLAERAETSLRSALETDPRHLEATLNSSLLEWRRDGLTDAELERRFSEAERASTDVARVQLLRARVRLLFDDPNGAVSALETAGTEGHSHAEKRELGLALLARHRLQRNDGDLERARELLSDVVEASPSDIGVVIALAEIYSLHGNHEVAEEALTRARFLDANLGESLSQAVVNYLPGHLVTRKMAHQAPLQSLLGLPNGQLVVRSVAGDAMVWARTGDQPIHRIDLGGPARQGRSMTAVNDVLIACLENAPLTVFDLESGRRLRNLRIHPGVAICVAASPDGRSVASGGSDRNLRIWDLESGECTQTLAGHGAFVSAVGWLPSRAKLVTASADGTVRIWHPGEQRCIQVFEGHRGPIRDIAVADDGQVALSAGQDGSIGVWDLEEGRCIRFLRGHSGAVTAISLVGRTVVSGGEDGTSRMWNLDTGEAQRIMRLANPVVDLAVVNHGQHVVVAHSSSVSQLLLPQRAPQLPLALAQSAASGELAGRDREFRAHINLARELIDDGRLEEAMQPLRAAREISGYELHHEALDLWNRVLAFFPKSSPRSVVELRRIGGGTIVTACRFAKDNDACLAGGGDGSLKIFETATGAEDGVFEGHTDRVTAVAICDDGSLLASAGKDGVVRVWEKGQVGFLREFKGHDGLVQAVVFVPDGSAVVTAGDDGTVRRWPLDEKSLPELLGRCEDAVTSISVCADGRFVVGGGWDSQVTVWSLSKGEELRRMAGHEGAIFTVATSPDCRLAASAGEDGEIRLWDLENGRCWRVLSGHEGSVHAVEFTPDARFLVSVGKDATLRLWNIRTGVAEKVVEGHAGPISDLALSRDGGAALSAGTDATLRLWFLDWEPESPESGRWDDRARPFLDVFLRRLERETKGGGPPVWNDQDIDRLIEDLGHRGFGWLDRDILEREIEILARNREEQRDEERQRTRELAKRQARQVRMAPAKQIAAGLTENLGIKLAGTAALVIVVLLALTSLRTPDSGEIRFNDKLHGEVSLLTRERGLRLRRGMVLSYQNQPSLGSINCSDGTFKEFVSFVLNTESAVDPPLDPGVPAADLTFRDRYAGSVNCVGRLGDRGVVDDLLERAAKKLHPYRLEDLLSIMVRVGGGEDPRVIGELDSRSETVRHFAALSVLYGGNENGVDTLVDGLQSDEMRVVEGASYVLTELIAIGAIDEASAFETVRVLCRNIDPKVRRNAVRALVHFEFKSPARHLMDELLEDSDSEVRLAADRTRETIRSVKIHELFG